MNKKCWLCSKFSNGFLNHIIVGHLNNDARHRKNYYKGKPYIEDDLVLGGKKCPICNGKGYLEIGRKNNDSKNN